ncbi:MAG: PaaI family thioesterase [Hyphomicrobiaceae bacterium]
MTRKPDTNETKPESVPLGPQEVMALIEKHFPSNTEQIGVVEIVSCGRGDAVVRLPFNERFTRPGGTISGPTMFHLADMTAYVSILSDLGETAIDSVTTTLTINFLARPSPEDLIGEVTTLRRGRRLSVCDVRIYCGSARTLVAQASCIYALPRSRSD